MKNYIDYFKNGLLKYGISCTEEQIDQFLCYYEYMMDVNKSLNLTRITDPKEVIIKHFLDSLSLASYYSFTKGQKVIDLGTGAGFPGIPLKIVFPELVVTLVDSLNKKVKFLNDMIGMLRLESIQAVHSRAEELSQHVQFREQYDLCVSRAVANLSILCEYCIPFVKPGGYFVSYKSGEIKEELHNSKHAVKLLGAQIERTEYFDLAGTENKRAFVFIKKTEHTKKMYPRKAGTPSKNPL